MIVSKTNEEWNKIVQNKDEQIKALYKRVKDQQTINDAQKKLNGVLQTNLTEAENKLKKIEQDRLNAGRKVGFDG